MHSQLILERRAFQCSRDCFDGFAPVRKKKTGMIEDLSLAAVVGSENNGSRMNHLGNGDSEWLGTAGLDPITAARQNLSFSISRYKIFSNDPVGMVSTEGRDPASVRIIFDLAAKMKPNCVAALPHLFKDRDCLFDTFLGRNPANHHKGVFLILPCNCGKFAAHRWVDDRGNFNLAIFSHQLLGPVRIGDDFVFPQKIAAGEIQIAIGYVQINPPQPRVAIDKPRSNRIEPLAHLLMPTEIGDEMHGRQAPVGQVIRADTDVIFVGDLSSEALEASRAQRGRTQPSRRPRNWGNPHLNLICVDLRTVLCVKLRQIPAARGENGDVVVVFQGLDQPHRHCLRPATTESGMADDDALAHHSFGPPSSAFTHSRAGGAADQGTRIWVRATSRAARSLSFKGSGRRNHQAGRNP